MSCRKSDKFIPQSDHDFADMALSFARAIARDPSCYMLSASDSEQITSVVAKFRQVLGAAFNRASRNQITTMQKNEARREAKLIVRRFANLIRANSSIDAIHKLALRIKPRPSRLQKRTCPKTAPMLTFVKSLSESASGEGFHVLRYVDKFGGGTHAKPLGAVRLELFVELIAPDEPPPAHPLQRSGGRGWYLGSFTKSPMRVAYPLPARPMRIVYWARWADAKCEVGPWSRTCIARVEQCTRASAMRIEDHRDDRSRRVMIIERIDRTPLLPEIRPARALPDAA